MQENVATKTTSRKLYNVLGRLFSAYLGVCATVIWFHHQPLKAVGVAICTVLVAFIWEEI